MKLYEINLAIEDLMEQLNPDPETGEIVADDTIIEQLHGLQMERNRILEYLAKLVLNIRASSAALKTEEKRLKDKRLSLAGKEQRILSILDRECNGEKTDCGVATVCYRKTSHVDVSDVQAATKWLLETNHENCVRIPEPEISKSEVKKLISAGEEVPGCSVVEDYSCSLR